MSLRLSLIGLFAFLACAASSAAPALASADHVIAPHTNQTGASGVSPAGRPVPSPRLGEAMAYDPATRQVILFGGTPGEQVPLGDTWAWNGKRWTQLHPATSPPARYLAGMVYDAATRQLVLFGGGDCWACYLNDTWTWNGTTWTKQHPAKSPPIQQQFGMAYDATTKQVVLASIPECPFATWTWNGKDWNQQHPEHSPGCRNGEAMAYDPVQRQVVLFGGWNGSNEIADTWVWDGSDWHHLHPTSHPPARGNTSMIFDTAEQGIVLFGGFAGFVSNPALDDTWLWDGSNWIEQHPTTSPSARLQIGTAYDARKKEVVLFGGGSDLECCTVNSDTWTWHRPWTTWTLDK